MKTKYTNGGFTGWPFSFHIAYIRRSNQQLNDSNKNTGNEPQTSQSAIKSFGLAGV